MRYNGNRPDIIVFNEKPYTVSLRNIMKSGQSGKRIADPNYFVCTPYSYIITDYIPYCAWHSRRDGHEIYDNDWLYRFQLTSYIPRSWGDLYPNWTAWDRADDASEDILSQLFDFWQGLKDTVDAIKTVSSTVSRIDAALPYLRDGNFSKAARTVTGRHIIANSWLEYNFAIKPTIHTAQLAIQYAVKDRSQAFRLHKKRSEILTSSMPIDDNYYVKGVVKARLKAEGSVTRFFTAWAMQQQFDRMAFTRPAPALWDAVPWSFAVDWFVPIGTWLDQMSRITQYSSDGCDVSCCRITGDFTFIPRRGQRFYSERNHCEDFVLRRVVNKTLGAKTWDLQGLLSRSEFGINARRLSYLTAIVASKYRKTFLGGLL